MNKVILVARLTADPELKESPHGPYTQFRVAHNKGKGGEADFFPCVAFGHTAEFLAKNFHKGERLLVDGRLTTSKNTKTTFYEVSVIADRVEFADGRKEA